MGNRRSRSTVPLPELPPEVIYHVLSFVDNLRSKRSCMRVSKYWKEYIVSSTTKLDLSPYIPKGIKKLHALFRVFPNVSSITIRKKKLDGFTLSVIGTMLFTGKMRFPYKPQRRYGEYDEYWRLPLIDDPAQFENSKALKELRRTKYTVLTHIAFIECEMIPWGATLQTGILLPFSLIKAQMHKDYLLSIDIIGCYGYGINYIDTGLGFTSLPKWIVNVSNTKQINYSILKAIINDSSCASCIATGTPAMDTLLKREGLLSDTGEILYDKVQDAMIEINKRIEPIDEKTDRETVERVQMAKVLNATLKTFK